MSAGYEHVEQDTTGDGALPTYDDLREREGPNSRFGRWQQWIEKRAAERYADDTYESYQRRRNRGWEPAPPPDNPSANYADEPPDDLPERDDVSYAVTEATQGASTRRTRTYLSESSVSETVTPPAGQRLDPCHLSLHTFGSRFIPHANGPIRAILPVLGDRYILIGHDEGLDVLDMFPDESFEGNTQDARRREIWRGEGVCQLALLEHASPGVDRTPQGVVLALISPEPTDSTAEGKEPPRILRMYNLASLVSLVRWTTSQKDAKPIDLLRASSPMDQTLHKKHHGRHHSLVKGFRNLSVETPPSSSVQPFPAPSTPSYAFGQDRSSSPPPAPPPKDYEPSLRARSSVSPPVPVNARSDSLSSIDTTDSWDVVDDLPLRWATDFVALASPGSKLFNLSVLFFEVWKADDGLGRTMLAIATKNTTFLYDTPQGARAFRYVKEFYTPLPPKSLAFVAQAHYDPLARAGSQLLSPRHADTGDARRLSLRGTSPPNIRPRSVSSSKAVPQLSLFVTFDKKAGLIRIGDAAVSELELWDDAGADSTHSSHGTFRRSLVAFDALGFGREGRSFAPWLPLSSVSVPSHRVASTTPLMETVYLLSRGKATHILPSPLPVPLSARAPLYILRWIIQPTHVHARVCRPSSSTGQRPFLQAMAFGEDGVEVQEVNLDILLSSSDVKGKGKATGLGTLRTQVDVGGPAGFLCMGGNWDDPLGFGYNLHRSDSVSTADSTEVIAQRNSQQGVYAWSAKGWEDFRVFWLGGDVDDPERGYLPSIW